MLIRGSCHCGNIAFSLSWEPDPTEIPARACGCSFCVKHGDVWRSRPNGMVCSRCGIVPVVTSRIDGHLHAVVSVNAFESVDQSLLRRTPANFDGEGTDDRLARRKRNWIASVEVTP